MTRLPHRRWLILAALLLLLLIVLLRTWVVTSYYVGRAEARYLPARYASSGFVLVNRLQPPEVGDVIAYQEEPSGRLCLAEVVALPGHDYTRADGVTLPAPRRGQLLHIDSMRIEALAELLHAELLVHSGDSVLPIADAKALFRWRHYRCRASYYLVRADEEHWVRTNQLRGRAFALLSLPK